MNKEIKNTLQQKENSPPDKAVPHSHCNIGDKVLLFSKQGIYIVTHITDIAFTVTCQRWLHSREHKDRKEDHLWSDLKGILN